MGYTKLMDKKGILAFLDFEKAFDTVHWEVIYDALNQFSLGPTFIKWVRTIYKEAQACVTNNGLACPSSHFREGLDRDAPCWPTY